MAATHFNGPVVSANGFTGDITGDIVGDVTGNLTGNVTGNVTGDVTGDITGNVTGNVTGDLTGNVGNTTSAEIALQCDVSAQTETIDSGVAVSVTKRITKIDNTVTGAGAITLAAPDATMLGMVKIIEMTVDGGDVTLALTNVDGGSAATTATFDAVGDALVLVAGVSKWHVCSETAALT